MTVIISALDSRHMQLNNGMPYMYMGHIIPSEKLTSLTLPKIFHRKYSLKNDKFLINYIFTDKYATFFT